MVWTGSRRAPGKSESSVENVLHFMSVNFSVPSAGLKNPSQSLVSFDPNFQTFTPSMEYQCTSPVFTTPLDNECITSQTFTPPMLFLEASLNCIKHIIQETNICPCIQPRSLEGFHLLAPVSSTVWRRCAQFTEEGYVFIVTTWRWSHWSKYIVV
jgi:hypothetical protein